MGKKIGSAEYSMLFPNDKPTGCPLKSTLSMDDCLCVHTMESLIKSVFVAILKPGRRVIAVYFRSSPRKHELYV